MINVIAIISLAITVGGENRKAVACGAELVLVARALLYVASWPAREGAGGGDWVGEYDFAEQRGGAKAAVLHPVVRLVSQ